MRMEYESEKLSWARKPRIIFALPFVLAFAPSCNRPSPEDINRDTTPPAFVEIRVVYQRVSDGLEVGSEVVPTTGLTRANLTRDRRIILGVSAADNESGIRWIQIDGDTEWDCVSSDTVAARKHGALGSRSDEVRNGTDPAGTPLIRNAHFSIDPFEGNPLRLVCSAADDASALDVKVVIRAQNGKGLEVVSAPITISYLPRPATP